MTDPFPQDPTMTKRDDFQARLILLLADLRMTQPPARRTQLRADCDRLLHQWLDLTGQQMTEAEVEALVQERNANRRWKPERWEPDSKAPG